MTAQEILETTIEMRRGQMKRLQGGDYWSEAHSCLYKSSKCDRALYPCCKVYQAVWEDV